MPCSRLLFALLFCSVALVQPRAETSAEIARVHFEAKRYAEARVVFEKLAAAEPANAEVQYYLGELALIRTDVKDAVAHLERATVLAPSNSTYFLQLGGAYGMAAMKAGLLSKFGFAGKAGAALEKSVQLDSENLHARNALMSYYQQAPSFIGGSMTKAYEQAGEIRRRNLGWGTSAIVNLYLIDKKFPEAFAALDEGLKAFPDDYYLHYLFGRAADEAGKQVELGERSLRRCLELTPQSYHPGHAYVYWHLGNLAQKHGDIAGARTAYGKSLGIDPNLKEARASFAKLNSRTP